MVEFDELSEEPLVSPDTGNSTKFHPSEAPEGTEGYWKRLAGYNSGVYNGYWTQQDEVRRLDNLAVYDAISSHVELTPFQRRQGRLIFDSLNLADLGYPVEAIAFCACLVSAERDGRTFSTRTPKEDRDGLLQKVASELGLRDRVINRCRNRIRSEAKATGFVL